MNMQDAIEQAYDRGIIYIADPPGLKTAHVFIYDTFVPLVKSGERGGIFQKSATDYLEYHNDEEILKDITASLRLPVAIEVDSIMNGRYKFELPYIRYLPILTATGNTLAIDEQINQLLEEMSRLSKTLLRYKNLPNSSEEQKQNMSYYVNNEISDILSTITSIIISHGNKDAIQLNMDRKLSQLARDMITRPDMKGNKNMKKTIILASTDTTFSSVNIAAYASAKIGEPVLQPTTMALYRNNYDALGTATAAHDILEDVRPREDSPSQIILMNNDSEFFKIVKDIIDKDLNKTGDVYDDKDVVNGKIAIWTI